VSLFDEMMVINKAFILIQFRIQEMADELLGGAKKRHANDSQTFPSKNDTKFSFSDVPQIQGLYLTSLVDLGSFCGSIDSFEYSLNFQ
jgi:hypothetical protein